MATISFTQAAHVGSLAIACEVAPPTGILSAVSTLAMGTLISFGVELVAQKGPFMMCLGRTFTHSALYRVEKTFKSNPENYIKSLRQAHERVMKHEKAYKKFCELHNFSSQEGALDYFVSTFERGTGYGETAAVAVKQLLNKEVIQGISEEDVYYHKMFFELEKSFHVQLDIMDHTMNVVRLVKQKEMLENKNFSRRALERFVIAYRNSKENEYKTLIDELQQEDPMHPLDETVLVASAFLEEYSKKFLSMPEFGYVDLPRHIFVFQASPERGYLIYDAIDLLFGGLMQYPDKETFVQHLKDRVKFHLLLNGKDLDSVIKIGKLKEVSALHSNPVSS